MPNVFTNRLLDEADGHLKTGSFVGAAPLVEEALRMEPKNVRALSFSAIIAANTGKNELALDFTKRALKLAPDVPMVMHNAGLVFCKCGQPHRAAQLWERLSRTHPSMELHWNLAMYHGEQDDPNTAQTYLRKVMEMAPRNSGLYLDLANAIKGTGRIEEAIALQREGARLFPQDVRQASNYLLALHYDPAFGPEQIYTEHAAWGRSFEAAIPAANGHKNERSPGRRLRIGYVSPDFRAHVVGDNFMPLLRRHDHSQFEIYCYSDTRRPDNLTPLFRQGADVWRDTAGLSDAELAAQVLQDRIDVLVDLVMHSGGSRLGMFARKPAPLQVTWLAYPGSTGLTRMDYRFTDPVLDPPGETDHLYTEKSIRLETFWCYGPPANSPAVGPLPADTNGHINFGCLNNFSKVNGAVLELWREILAAVPKSRLVLVLPKGKVMDRVREKLAVAPNRLVCLPRISIAQYLDYYNSVDLALDPFPFTGGITTLDALWMGVPVVTLPGPIVVSRGSLSIFSNMGLTELAVKNKSDYVALAVALARDQDRLRQLRAELRERLERSVLMDSARFARQVELAYRAMWQKWCASAPSS